MLHPPDSAFNFRFTVFGMSVGSIWLAFLVDLCRNPQHWKGDVPLLLVFGLMLVGAYRIWKRGPKQYDIQPVFGDTAVLHGWVVTAFTASFLVGVAWLLTHLKSPAPFYGSWVSDAFHFALFIDAVAFLATGYWLRRRFVLPRHVASALIGFLITLTPLSMLCFDSVNRLCDWHSAQTLRTPVISTHRFRGYERHTNRPVDSFYATVKLPEGTADLRVDPETYGELATRAGAEAEVELRPGAFGYPWIRDYQVHVAH